MVGNLSVNKILFTLVLGALLTNNYAEDVKTVVGAPPTLVAPGDVIVRTNEDVKQGKKNVESVVSQLKDLFQPVNKRKRSTPVEDKPYIKIIPASDGRANLIYKVRHATSKKLVSAIEPLLGDNGSMDFAEEQNLFLISDSADNINALAETLPLIDVASPQVLIEAKVIEVAITDGMQRNLSVTYNKADKVNSYDSKGNPVSTGITNTAGFKTSSLNPNSTSDGGTFNWVFSYGDNNIATSFQWLLNAQDAKVLSSPTILVARNEKSVISNGQDVPIQSQTTTSGTVQTSTTFKRVGVTLTVTPLMLNSDSVTLKVEPQVSNIQSYQTIAQGDSYYQVPVISVRNISTYVKLNDGQVVVMGGLYSNRESVLEERIPWLSDLPGLGEFFTSKFSEKELLQLMFFLKVRILTPDDLADGILFDPEEIANDSEKIGDIIRKSPVMPNNKTSKDYFKEEFKDEINFFKGKNKKKPETVVEAIEQMNPVQPQEAIKNKIEKDKAGVEK